MEDWDPFIDTLDYIFHTPGITATKVRRGFPLALEVIVEDVDPSIVLFFSDSPLTTTPSLLSPDRQAPG